MKNWSFFLSKKHKKKIHFFLFFYFFLMLHYQFGTTVNLPREFWLLNYIDRQQYFQLRSSLSQLTNKRQRNQKIAKFAEALEIIKKWAIRGDQDDHKRCLTCGVLWFDDGIAINTQHLKELLVKCKSSINTTLHDSGFDPYPKGNEGNELVRMFPFFKNNLMETRKWTLRKKTPKQQPLILNPYMLMNRPFKPAQ